MTVAVAARDDRAVRTSRTWVKSVVWALVGALRRVSPTRVAATHIVMKLLGSRVLQPAQAAALLSALHGHTTDLIDWQVRFDHNRLLRLELPVNAAIDLLVFPLFEHPQEGTTYRVFADLARDAKSVCDVGANLGGFTYLAASVMQPGGTVVAIEPNPVLAACIERNLVRNRLEGVRVIRAAAGDQNGSAVLHVPAGGGEKATLHQEWVAGSPVKEVAVSVVRLDSALSQRPDVLKVDVEQHELAVIAGLSGYLADGRPDLIVELVGPESHRTSVANLLVGTYGYDMYYITHKLQRAHPEFVPYEQGFFNFLFTVKTAPELRECISLEVSTQSTGASSHA